jgi:hypothetical protein
MATKQPVKVYQKKAKKKGKAKKRKGKRDK